MLISNQHNEVDKHDAIDLILQALQMVSHLPKPHGDADQKIVKKLIKNCYSAMRTCDESYLTVVSFLSILADRLMEVFLIPNPYERHYWIEHRIAHLYGEIFDILFCEIPSHSAAVHLLLTEVIAFFQRDLKLNVKLDIIQLLLRDGLQKTIKLLYDLTKTDSSQFTQFESVITEILTHYVYQFEFGSTKQAFIRLKLKIQNLIQGVTWLDVISSDFQIFNLQQEGISASNLWLIILVSHLETEQNKFEWTGCTKREINHVLNLTTCMSVCCLKQYNVPTYLMKYLLEGIAVSVHVLKDE